MSQQSNKKKEEQGIDTSYGANAVTGATPETTAPTSVPTVTATVDTSYGANGANAPTGAVAPSGSAPAVDTSYGANSGKVFSFSEWAKQEEERLAREKDLTYQRAEELRQQEYDTAAIARERAVADARTSYAQNMAGYGAKAEQMGSMGLAGSGYGDYIDSQAYATQRAEVQYANAQEQAAQRQARYAEQEAKYGADVSYSQNMSALGKEQATYYESKMNEEQQDLYNSLVAQVQSGTLTKEQAIEQARTGGLSDSIIGMITATADSYVKTEGEKKETESYNATLANVNAGNYASADAVREAAAAAGITNANLVSQLVAAWTVHNAGVTDEKEAEAFTTVYANIESGSYATREAAEQAARNAGITNENLISQIGAAWDTRNNAQGDEYRANYTNLLDLARNGTWNAEDIAVLAQKYGMSEEDINTLKAAASTAYTAAQDEKGQISEETYNQNYATIEQMAKSGAYTADEIRAWCEKLKIDDETDVATLIAAVQRVNASNNEYEDIVSSGAVTPELITEIETAVNSGDISEADRDRWAQQWSKDMMETEDSFLDVSGSRLSKKDATAMLNETINNPWCTSELENYLRRQFTAIYSTDNVNVENVVLAANGSLSIWYNNVIFEVMDPPKAEGDVIVASEELADGTVFVHGNLSDETGNIYYKHNGTVYLLKGESSWAGAFEMDYLKGLLSGKLKLPEKSNQSNGTTGSTTTELERATEDFKEQYELPKWNWTTAQEDLLWNLASSNNYEGFAAMLPATWSDTYKRKCYEAAGGK